MTSQWRDIVRAGYDRADVERVTRLIKISSTSAAKPVNTVQITRRNFGKDWRYPIEQIQD